MFIRTLRQLYVLQFDLEVILQYRCKNCNSWVEVTLEKQEYEDLKFGYSFNLAIATNRKDKLIHFSQGVCLKHIKQQ